MTDQQQGLRARATTRSLFIIIIAFAMLMAGTSRVSSQQVAQNDDWSWQNPNLAANPYNNIHNDSWFTDTYPGEGPEDVQNLDVNYISKFLFDDPKTGSSRSIILGECAAHAYDADGNLVTVCQGLPDLAAQEFQRSIATISPDGALLSWAEFTVSYTNLADAVREFGGIGYFYLDNQDRVVMGMPNGHIVTWERQDSAVSEVDSWNAVKDINITGDGGPVPPDRGALYALVPNDAGYTWFTTTKGVVGTVAPDGCTTDCVKWIDINDRNNDGVLEPQPDGGMQTISESHSVNGNSTFQQSNYFMYRFDMRRDGTPKIGWKVRYDRGTEIKPGQTSQGSGTSPVYFEMGGREFVTIMDNATRPNINVYRAERRLGRRENRLFASVAPMGRDDQVSNENSLIVYPGPTENSRRIFAENNWGNTSFLSTVGPLTTRPGFGGIEVSANGRSRALPLNEEIRVPSIVSKASIASDAVYTYEKKASGWYLTALDPNDPTRVQWSVRVGGGMPKYNNWYAQLSLAPDGETIYVGSLDGILQLTPSDGPPTPNWCTSVLDAENFVQIMGDLAEWESGPIWYPEYLEAAFAGWAFEFESLEDLIPPDDVDMLELLETLKADVIIAEELLAGADFDVSQLGELEQLALGQIAPSHWEFIAAAFLSWASSCTTTELDDDSEGNVRIMLYRSYLPTDGFDNVPLPEITLVKNGVETKLPPCPTTADNSAWVGAHLTPSSLAGTVVALTQSPGFTTPGGPFPYCSWWGITTVENFNIAAPDENAAYWFMPFIADEGTEVYIDGEYPDERYMSLALYNGVANPYEYNGVSSTIADYLIDPDAGSENPWQVEAEPGGSYRVTIESDPDTSDTNVLPWYQTNTEGARSTMPAPCGTSGAINAACPLSNMFMSPPQTAQAGIFSNVDNRYMMSIMKPDNVIVLRGKKPTTPTGTSPAPWPDAQFELRYFSVCSIVYVRPYPAVEQDGCAVDFEIPVDDDGMYSIVYSTAANRPSNATLENGYAWIELFPGVRNFLVMRHLLPNEGFAQAAQNVPQDAAWTSGLSVMEEFYPTVTIECSKDTFELDARKCWAPVQDEDPAFIGIGNPTG